MNTDSEIKFARAHHVAIGMLTGKPNQDPSRLHPDLAWTIGLAATHVKNAVEYQGYDMDRELRSTQVIATIIAFWQIAHPGQQPASCV